MASIDGRIVATALVQSAVDAHATRPYYDSAYTHNVVNGFWTAQRNLTMIYNNFDKNSTIIDDVLENL